MGIPLLDLMLNDHGTLLAQGQPIPRRFGTFFWGNGRGVVPERWTPAVAGVDWALSPQLEPLADVKAYINLVTGSEIKLTNSPRGHHNGVVGVLAGADFIAQEAGNSPYRSTFATQSIDQLVAAAIGKESLFRSLELGISESIVRGEGTTLEHISHNGPDSANPAETDPGVLFDRVFGSTMSPGGRSLQRTSEARKSALDAVLQDITDLRARVGSRDRVRLEQHFEHVRRVENRLGANAALDQLCTEAVRPSVPGVDGGREPLAERTQAMSDIIALAFACDMTRVFSMLFSGSVCGTVFWQVGAERGHHEMSHDGAATQDLMDAATIFTMTQFAVLLATLRDMPEGAGNVLDQCCILASSDCSNGATHSIEDYPVVLAGGGGGSLRNPGLHLAVNGDNTSKILLTAVRAAGVLATELGAGEGKVTESISALES
jgi:hypothetical protein